MTLAKSLTAALVLAACLAGALLLEWSTTPPPTSRAVHIEAFRYGTYPYLIRAVRGDELILTFSTLDTGHSFFLQDYRIDAKISPASEQVEVRDPLVVGSSPRRVKEVRLKAGLKGWWGSLVSLSRFRCHVYCGPMHGFEQGDLIVRPNWLFSGGLGILAGMILAGTILALGWESPAPPLDRPGLTLNPKGGRLARLLRWRPLQFTLALPLLAGLVVVIMAGLLGTKVSGRNAAVMLTWILGMSALTLLLVPLGGRIWCAVCPLPILGEYLQRRALTRVRAEGDPPRNLFLGLGLRWPRSLQSRWLGFALFMVVGVFSASLAGQPRWTAVALGIVVLLALAMSLVWELRAFCRYVCPVASYISVHSLNAPLRVRKREAQVCRSCRERSCQNGSARGWACPYGLNVAGMVRNADCGLCTECFKSCPNDNVALSWRRGPWQGSFSSKGEAFRALALLAMAAVYSLTIHSPWPGLRDMVNLVDKPDWLQFGLFAGVVWTIALGVVPLLFWLLTSLGLALSGPAEKNTGAAFRETMPSVLPLGLAMWAVFFVDTLMSNSTFLLMALSDPFGWGWDLLGTAGMPWVQVWPSGVPWIQAGVLLLGFWRSLSGCYRRWLRLSGDRKKALAGAGPTILGYAAISAGMLAFLTNY